MDLLFQLQVAILPVNTNFIEKTDKWKHFSVLMTPMYENSRSGDVNSYQY